MSRESLSPPDGNFSAENAAFAERLFRDFLIEPSRVPTPWRKYFVDLFESSELPHVERLPSAVSLALLPSPPAVSSPMPPVSSPVAARKVTRTDETTKKSHIDSARLQDRVEHLVRTYRVRGHLAAKLDPLGLARPEPADLSPEFHGLTAEDMRRTVSLSSAALPEPPTVAEVVLRMRNTYCRYIGVQFMHIDDPAARNWLMQRMERSENHIRLSREEQLRILKQLTDAVIFERFVRKKYVGAKTFSLEGSESLIPLLDLAIVKAARQGIVEIVMGMAHRGRLNVLANIIGKRPQEIFWEFADSQPELRDAAGDLAYHLGFSSDWEGDDGRKVHLSLCFNPSHLEYIDPVAIGRMRAKQDRALDGLRRHGMVLLVHGDAAFAGEGVVQETLNMSQLDGYTTGGTLHVIVNNQLGFTTSPREGRSTSYASDVAKMLQIPIFHVNGEHPESVAQVVDLAMDFRAQFHRDVVIDMYGYRRWGHNEADEPGFTQPLLYKAIERQPSVRDGYLEHLLELGGVTRPEAEQIASERHEKLERAFEQAHQKGFRPAPDTLTGIWNGYSGGPESTDDDPKTGVSLDNLRDVLVRLTQTPEGFHLHKKLERSVEHRREMAELKRPLDWSAAEALAFGTLAVEGHPVRLSGQDSQRGTFSQRHAVLHDIVSGQPFCPLQQLNPEQASVEIINSPLSESGVLGFEYGYSLDCPEALVAWEAQFGDFVNAGQVIIDQFIAAAADRWRRLSGLVLLLPHGLEGMGPEHSSARLERFLTLAAGHNLQIVYPTMPVQYFHCLRRQVLRRWRKPLVVFTPKSLLRHTAAVSTLQELAEGRFQRILADQRPADNRETKRVLLCSGKLYFDLAEFREQQTRWDVAILRVEQLYPLADDVLQAALEPYRDGTSVYWVQEEPQNMGARAYWRGRFGARLFDRLPFDCIARPESASPATGSKAIHKREQHRLLEQAFG